MENNFDALIDSFIENKVGIDEHFLSLPLANHLCTYLKFLNTDNQFNLAGTGHHGGLSHNTVVRSDKIYWLDRAHDNEFENAFLDLIDQFVQHLNTTCYTGISGYEFHYAIYEKGTFYKRHLDQFQDSSSRQYSMICYLNTDWKVNDGGELCIHNGSVEQNISPTMGKAVFFKSSEMEHEVKETQCPRLSITGWLKK